MSKRITINEVISREFDLPWWLCSCSSPFPQLFSLSSSCDCRTDRYSTRLLFILQGSSSNSSVLSLTSLTSCFPLELIQRRNLISLSLVELEPEILLPLIFSVGCFLPSFSTAKNSVVLEELTLFRIYLRGFASALGQVDQDG